MYQPVESRANFSQNELEVLSFWEEYGTFFRSLKQRENAPLFVQYDGPPFATGLPHYGHLMQSILKDVFPRYYTMRGFCVPRHFGWDCHGLPIEYKVERDLGVKNKSEIENYGVANFNERCRQTVLEYSQKWERYFHRIGRWVDFNNVYKTMDPDFMESIWSVFKKLWERSLVEEGYRIFPYCARCGTVLSNHELNLAGYREVVDPSASVRFAVIGKPCTYFLAWTTTPWTLPSNLALAVNPELTYVTIRDKEGDSYILAEGRLSFYYEPGSYTIVWKGLGKGLSEISYEPLFEYFQTLRDQGAFRVFCADYVTDDEGTGIVHTANGFGEDDYNLLKNVGIPIISPVDGECCFTSEVPEYQGRFVRDCNEDILTRLQESGNLIGRQDYSHNCPYCYRCGSVLIYRAIHSWFVLVSDLRSRLCKANDQVQWIPSHLKKGRFGKWLENARDWTISRNRYWGNPIPVWRCDICKKVLVIGSRVELQEKSGVWLEDLHKQYVDQVTIPCSKCGMEMTRILEVFDCWFESGSMPYALSHCFLGTRRQDFDHFPLADFVAEGIDQTRGWFYTLMVLAVALFGCPAFKMGIATGLVLADDGRKMSKSSRNYKDPLDIVGIYGADAVRLYLLSSSLTRGEDLKFDEKGVRDSLKNTIIPLWNAYSFFVTYANIDKFQARGKVDNLEHPLDRWIVSSVWKLVDDIDSAMGRGEIYKSVYEISQFINQLNNWYIRRSRRRFWKSGNDIDKISAYETLYFSLLTLIKICAPFIPFVTEIIYRNLKRKDEPLSIHLCNWPVAFHNARDVDLETRMSLAMRTVAIGHRLRSMYDLKTRLPLRKVYVVSSNVSERAILNEMTTILAEELNVKHVDVLDKEENLITYKAKANFRILGPILGDDMNIAATTIADLGQDQIQGILSGTVIVIGFQGRVHQQLKLDRNNVIVVREKKKNVKALNEGTLTVALDTYITKELRDEGVMRDLIRAIQNQRKVNNFAITDRIFVWLFGNENLEHVVQDFEQILKNETLTEHLVWERKPEAISVHCGDTTIEMLLQKTTSCNN